MTVWDYIKSPLYGKYIKIYNNKKRQNIDEIYLQIYLYNVFEYILKKILIFVCINLNLYKINLNKMLFFFFFYLSQSQSILYCKKKSLTNTLPQVYIYKKMSEHDFIYIYIYLLCSYKMFFNYHIFNLNINVLHSAFTQKSILRLEKHFLSHILKYILALDDLNKIYFLKLHCFYIIYLKTYIANIDFNTFTLF